MATASSPGGPPKTLSSRLLTMKFMQRASASPSTEPTPEEPSPKRRKTEQTPPPKFSVDALADSRAVQVAFAEEEAKKQAALDKQAIEAGDSRWVLKFEGGLVSSAQPTFRIVQTGFGSLDTSLQPRSAVQDQTMEDNAVIGRRSYGQFNRVVPKGPGRVNKSKDSTEDGDSNMDDQSDEGSGGNSHADADEEENDVPTVKGEYQSKEGRSAKRKAEMGEPQAMAKKRRKKEVKLNVPGRTSLTGRQDPKCYKCGGPHIQKDCPARSGNHHFAQAPQAYGGSGAKRHGPLV